MPRRPVVVDPSFGPLLRQLREERGLSLAALAKLALSSSSHLHEFETGKKTPSVETAQRLDEVLDAGGRLLALIRLAPVTPRSRNAEQATAPTPAGEKTAPVERRRLLVDLGVIGLAAPLATAETVRHEFADALGAGGEDEWEQIADEYGRSFYATPPAELLRDLTADMDVLARTLSNASRGSRRRLSRTGAELAAIAAMGWASTGEMRHAHRWWRTARQAADRSGDLYARTWVRGWEVADGLYEQRPVAAILDRAAEATALAGDYASAGTAGLYAGLAQTLAADGREEEALVALARVADITASLPAEVVADEDSMFGWPEVRLRHTESYVHTALGHTREAYSAQERALALYPDALARERAAMLLHRAACMIQDGDVAGGVAYAGRVLDELPAEHHTELVYVVGRTALDALPEQERRRPPARELSARLALSAGRPA